MTEQQSPPSRYRRGLVITVYVLTVIWGGVQAMFPVTGAIYYLFGVIQVVAITGWIVSDARDRGKPILHIVQLFILLLCPISLLIYLIATRGFRGLGLSVAHAIGITIAAYVGFYVTVFAVYGPGAFAASA